MLGSRPESAGEPKSWWRGGGAIGVVGSAVLQLRGTRLLIRAALVVCHEILELPLSGHLHTSQRQVNRSFVWSTNQSTGTALRAWLETSIRGLLTPCIPSLRRLRRTHVWRGTFSVHVCNFWVTLYLTPPVTHTSDNHQSIMRRSHYFIISLCLRFNGHLPDGPGLASTRMSPFWILLELKTGATRRAKLQSKCHYQQTNILFSQAGCPSCRPTKC